MAGWWYTTKPTPLKNDGVRTSWDDDYSQLNGQIKNVPNHQPDKIRGYHGDIMRI